MSPTTKNNSIGGAKSSKATKGVHASALAEASKPARHRLLVVDAEPRAMRFVNEVCAARHDCEVITARSVAEANRVLETTGDITMLVTDLKLPDGDGLSLVAGLRRSSPHAGVMVTARGAGLEDAVEAFRGGASDLVVKPFTSEQIADRIGAALARQDALARNDRKIARLREAVRKLSDARRTVSKKVDLLCNDLVGAYGELSRQMDAVRVQEDFRKLCDRATDLEQLLCHAMDWIMRRVGYANIAVFLAADEAETNATTFQLGAYVKYTMASSPELTDSLRDGTVARAGREGFVRMNADDAARELTAAELRHLRGQAVVAANCTYLGESLATVVLFRDGASPFTNEDAETFRAIAPIFAIALAGQVKGPGGAASDSSPEDDAASPEDGASPKEKRDDKTDADWWKRGEAPPF